MGVPFPFCKFAPLAHMQLYQHDRVLSSPSVPATESGVHVAQFYMYVKTSSNRIRGLWRLIGL